MKNFTIKAKTEKETRQRRERERERKWERKCSRGDSSCKCGREVGEVDGKTQAREASEFGFVTGASFVFVRPTV